MAQTVEKGKTRLIHEYRPRLLPVLVTASAVLFGFKVVAVWNGTERLVTTLGTPALAEDKVPGDGALASKAAETPGQAPVAAQAPKADSAPAINGDDSGPSASELQVLQSLAKRRDELAGRERSLDMREAMLKAAEQRVDQKIARLAALQADIQKLVHQNDEAEDARIRSLVKVYEAMKPQDAARIFEKLDRGVLLDVAERMKEAKMAPILAAMEPASAQAITVALATRRKLPDEIGSAGPQPGSGAGG